MDWAEGLRSPVLKVQQFKRLFKPSKILDQQASTSDKLTSKIPV
ncbi:MAG TPA: hypothetical protein V6D19_19630 [Stenomitos sp.]